MNKVDRPVLDPGEISLEHHRDWHAQLACPQVPLPKERAWSRFLFSVDEDVKFPNWSYGKDGLHSS